MRSTPKKPQGIDWELIHGPYLPASVYPGMGVTATATADDGAEVPLRIWRLSPQGIEFTCVPELHLEVGQALTFELMLAGQKLAYSGTVVSPEHADGDIKLSGVKYEPQERVATLAQESREDRQKKRFRVSKRFFPTGVAYAPLTFHDAILFTVKDVSATGMRLSTSMRNKFLVPGLVLTAQIHFPPMASSTVKLRICNLAVVNEDGQYFQSIGAHIVEHDSAFAAAMGQYILQFGEGKEAPTPKEVTDQQLAIDNHANIIDWGFAETVKDFKDVAALRLLTYADESRDNIVRSMTFDDRSRMLIGRFRGQIVASLRLIFCSLDDDLFEVESYMPLPPQYLQRMATAEPSLLCIHPDFQHTDLALDLMRFTMFVMLQASRRWAIHASNPYLVPFLLKIGFVDTGLKLPATADGRAHWHVLHADIEAIVDGRGIGPVMWNKLFHGREEHLHHQHWRKTGKVDAMRLATYRMLEPAAGIIKKISKRS